MDYGSEAQGLEPLPRGEEHTPLVSYLTANLLRNGLVCKLASYVIVVASYLMYSQGHIFTYQAHSEMPASFHAVLALTLLVNLAGVFSLACFQALVADDSKWTTGFRTGSKLLGTAILLDALATLLRLVQYSTHVVHGSTVAHHRFGVSKSDWLFFGTHNALDAAAYLFYGLAFWYMEAYHDEGTEEQSGWAVLGLYAATAFLLVEGILSGRLAALTVALTAAALARAALWAAAFEPLLAAWSPELHSRSMATDILPGEQLKPAQGGQRLYANKIADEHRQPPPPGAFQAYGGQEHDPQPGIPTSYDYHQLYR